MIKNEKFQKIIAINTVTNGQQSHCNDVWMESSYSVTSKKFGLNYINLFIRRRRHHLSWQRFSSSRGQNDHHRRGK